MQHERMIEDLDRKAILLRLAYLACLAIGVMGAIVLGIHFGRAYQFHDVAGPYPAVDHSTRGWTVFAAIAFGTFVSTTPIIGLSWTLAGQAALLRELAPSGD